MRFEIGDFAVCPGHGVGQIFDIQEESLQDETKTYYLIKLMNNGMKVMIPVESQDGIRSLAGTQEIEKVFSLLENHDVQVDNSAWNRRYREYMEKIKTGCLIEIADVLRSLFLLKNVKKLSFGEKKLLDRCKYLLIQEISLSKGNEKSEVLTEIEACFS